jgi:hypothetical protein
MDDIDLVKLFQTDNKLLGVLFAIAAGIFFLVKSLKAIKNVLESFFIERTFETYNDNLKIASEKITTYTLKTLTLKRNSQEIYEFLKSVYDLANKTKIDNKTIKFKLYELQDDIVLYSNLIKFLDYYRLNNGVRILLFLANSEIKEEIKIYVERLKIYGVKIV